MPLIPLHQTIGAFIPGLIPPAPPTYAAWPVWRGSTTSEVKFQPLAKKEAHRLWHKARRFERQTRRPGKQDGALGRNGIAVIHALLFDFLNYRSGALYPSVEAIAKAACISVSSAFRGLADLKAAGVVNWLRRAEESITETGGFILKQITNASAVLSSSQWRGYSELRLYTHEKMYENLAIYSAHGWQEYARANEGGYDRVFMRKPM